MCWGRFCVAVLGSYVKKEGQSVAVYADKSSVQLALSKDQTVRSTACICKVAAFILVRIKLWSAKGGNTVFEIKSGVVVKTKSSKYGPRAGWRTGTALKQPRALKKKTSAT